MCGIVYAHDFEGTPVNNGVLNIFDKQRHRGVQGFGVFDGQEGHIIRATTEDKILKWLCRYDSNLILFHHRYPTSTPNIKRSAHPFSTKDYFGKTQYIFVHNGIIPNAEALRKEHEKLGITYRSGVGERVNDSEALMWDLVLYLEGQQETLKAHGAMAFICIKTVNGKLDKMFFGRNNNPLNMLRAKPGILLSSEGTGDPIDSHMLYTWNYKAKRLTTKYLTMPSSSSIGQSRYIQGNGRYPEPTYEDYSDGWGNESIEDRFELDDKEQAKAHELAERFLKKHKGHFKKALNDLETEYMDVGEITETADNYRELRIYEEAIIRLESHPEWIVINSVASGYGRVHQVPLLPEGRMIG